MKKNQLYINRYIKLIKPKPFREYLLICYPEVKRAEKSKYHNIFLIELLMSQVSYNVNIEKVLYIVKIKKIVRINTTSKLYNRIILGISGRVLYFFLPL